MKVSTENVIQWIEIAKLVLPWALAAAGVPANLIPKAVDAATEAEAAMGPGTGAQKLQHVIRAVEDVLAVLGKMPDQVAHVSNQVANGIAAGIAQTDAIASWHWDTVGKLLAHIPSPGV